MRLYGTIYGNRTNVTIPFKQWISHQSYLQNNTYLAKIQLHFLKFSLFKFQELLQEESTALIVRFLWGKIRKKINWILTDFQLITLKMT